MSPVEYSVHMGGEKYVTAVLLPQTPANRYGPDNPVNPANRYSPNNPFNPANQYNPDNPLNLANRCNPTTPIAPSIDPMDLIVRRSLPTLLLPHPVVFLLEPRARADWLAPARRTARAS